MALTTESQVKYITLLPGELIKIRGLSLHPKFGKRQGRQQVSFQPRTAQVRHCNVYGKSNG